MTRPDLATALGLGQREVVAFVGGGGKTTSMYRLCREASARGGRAVASGTARFTLPPGRPDVPVVIEEDESLLLEAVRARLTESGWLIAATGVGSKERLLPLSFAAVRSLATDDGLHLVALEADGSKMRSFKAPAEHEPAVPPDATTVVAVVGADIFGRPLDDAAVHRPEVVAGLSGASLGDPVTPAMVARVLTDQAGGRKGVPSGARFVVLINKAYDSRLPAARHAARMLLDMGVERVVLGHIRDAEGIVEVLGGQRRPQAASAGRR